MVISRDHPDSSRYKIHDCTGQVIPYVTFFDTETCEIEMAIFLRNERIVNNDDGEYKIVAAPEDLNETVKEQACLLMQSTQTEDGEKKIGYTFVRFKLPGSYATFDGKQLDSSEVRH